MHIDGKNRKRGFSILELIIVLSIVLVVAAMVAPRMMKVVDQQRLQLAAQDYAGLVQTARARASQDNTFYQILVAQQPSGPVAYVDLNGNSQLDAGEPLIQLPYQVTVTDNGVPPGFDTAALLGRVPLNLETQPPMLNDAGAASPGLAFNERGLPCQRIAPGANCLNATTVIAGGVPQVGVPVAWVTYLSYQQSGGGVAWAAVTATPAGRIKSWSYQVGANGGTWQ
jgi:prepilin-type N-terminal cleavage/methylation domain-containing protein